MHRPCFLTLPARHNIKQAHVQTTPDIQSGTKIHGMLSIACYMQYACYKQYAYHTM